MISMSLDAVERGRVKYVIANNFPGENERWATAIEKDVRGLSKDTGDVTLFGHKKDESSFYLELFPKWKLNDTGLHETLDATQIRDAMFNDELESVRSNVPPQVFSILERFQNSSTFTTIKESEQSPEDGLLRIMMFLLKEL